jgi:hypothetical protein
VIAVYAAGIQKDGETEQKQMEPRRYAFVSKPARQDHRGKGVTMESVETAVSEGFDQGNLQEGAVS